MTNSQDIFIIGSGAIGLVLGVKLAEQHKNVTLIKIRSESLTENTVSVSIKENGNSMVTSNLPMYPMEHLRNKSGLFIITSKAFINEKLAKLFKEYTVQGPIVLLQNGLGVEKPFLEENFSDIYRCVLFATSMKLDKTIVQYKPVAPSPIGIVKGSEQILETIVTNLSTPTFNFVSQPDIAKTVWEKATLNAVFNSICPLLDIDNGIFHRDKEARSLALEIIRECIVVASKLDIVLSEDEIMTKLLSISKNSDGQLISTLQDIRSGNETEIKYLNLEIASIASQSNPKILVDKTKLLGEMISLKSAFSENNLFKL